MVERDTPSGNLSKVRPVVVFLDSLSFQIDEFRQTQITFLCSFVEAPGGFVQFIVEENIFSPEFKKIPDLSDRSLSVVGFLGGFQRKTLQIN